MLKYLAALKRDEKGVTALEYGLIAALIAVAIIGGVSSIGSNLSATFSKIQSHFVGGNVTN